MKALYLLIVGLLLTCCKHSPSSVAETSGDEENLIVDNGLSNQKVNTFAQDAQGHIWIGTFRGLNKYDAHEYHQYFCTDDSLGLPDNQINHLLRDSKGRLWIATVNGVCLYTDCDNFKRIPIDIDNKNGYQLLESKEGKIFLSTMHQLAVYDPDRQKFAVALQTLDPHHTFKLRCFIDANDRLWTASPFELRCYNSSTLALEGTVKLSHWPNYFFLQPNGNLWMSGNHHTTIYNTFSRKFIALPHVISEHPELRNANIDCIHPYGDNSLLLSTERQGLFLYNYRKGSVIHQTEEGFPFEAPPFKVTCAFTDSQQNLWFGSVDQGYAIRYSYKERFNTNNYLTQSLRDKSVLSLAVDKEQNLWIATRTSGLYAYNLNNQKLRHITFPKEAGEDEPDISRIFVDSEGILWMASAKENKIWKCHYQEGALQAERSYTVFMPMQLTEDRRGRLWVGGSNYQLHTMSRGKDTFDTVDLLPAWGTFVPGLELLPDGRLMVAAFMKPLMIVDPDTRKCDSIRINPQEMKACIRRSVFIPTALFRDSRNEMWIGTIANGLLRYSPRTNKLEAMNGTACKDISAIEEDGQGNLWISTLYGLSRYDHTTEQFTNYYASDGIGGNQFNDRASCRLPNGTLAFGGTHGLTLFNPIDVNSKRKVPLLFEGLKIHNRPVRPQAGSVIERHLSYQPDIRLKHDDNGFSISFAALDYCEYERIHYYYRMEGFDPYWVDARNNREAYYANLPAGNYTFRVRITNNDKSIVETENAIHITVAPSPWQTWWAWLIYVTTGIGIISLLVTAYRRVKTEKEAAQHAEREKEQEQRINSMNMSFFANISHEFRTPLTMIAAPVTQLCHSPLMGKEELALLHIIQRSIQRMLRLVNQVMDFNKLENDTLKLQVKRTDIIAQLQRIVEIFRFNAAEKGITLNTQGLEDTFLTWLDIDKLDKIMGNLLANALKFTSTGGSIELSFDVVAGKEALTEGKPCIKIVVSDTGTGIPEDQLERIFERYYQLNNQSTGIYNWGTGIGLYYARSLAVLHHGTLAAANRREGTGAVFTLLLPIGDDCYAGEERIHLQEEGQEKAFPLETVRTEIPAAQDTSHTDHTQVPLPADASRATLFVVDDDTEVVHYLNTLLASHYRVVCRFDADSALNDIREEAPDLVLSDVVMPGKDGYELCQQLKGDNQLCHIPIILVTAKATVENQVKGLNTGADAYVTKPFDPNYLLALIQSLLSNREKVRRLLGRSTQTDELPAQTLAPQDNAFMSNLYRLMESELSNTELDVNHMTELMHISRTKFYYKVKGLTGENPGTFFKTYKLNRAASLIAEGKYTVSEIADMTGFSTLSHFSTSFKKQFGVTPSEYRK